ncbi:N-acetylglucosamine kinase [Glaciibacter psychrotolerans]
MCTILAIDAGGTATRAVIVLPSGHCVGLGLAVGGNPISSGFDAALHSIAAAIADARTTTGPSAAAVTSTVIAMAGAGAHSREQLSAGLVALGIGGPVQIVSDVLAMFRSGTLAPDGYVLVAGTGAVAARIENGSLAAVSDGLGWLLGDAGSGYWIGHRVAAAVAADLDGRGPATALTDLLLAELNTTAGEHAASPPTTDAAPAPVERPPVLTRLIESLYALRPVELSRFAPLAFRAADSVDDAVARAILTDAAAELGTTFAAVADPVVTGPVVLGGSVLNSGLLAHRTPLGEALRAATDSAPLLSARDGIVGAAVLGLMQAGFPVDETIFRRITDDVAALLAQSHIH